MREELVELLHTIFAVSLVGVFVIVWLFMVFAAAAFAGALLAWLMP